MALARRNGQKFSAAIWPGFVANSIFYAAALGILLIARGAMRRTLRRRRGQCVHCAYDLRGSGHAACPECGRPLPRLSEPRS